MTDPGETEAILKILLGICERWDAEEEHRSPLSPSEKVPELITETVLLVPTGGIGNSSIPPPGISLEDPGMVETVIVSRDSWKGNIPINTAVKAVGDDFLAETVILEKGRKSGKDGTGK